MWEIDEMLTLPQGSIFLESNKEWTQGFSAIMNRAPFSLKNVPSSGSETLEGLFLYTSGDDEYCQKPKTK